MTKPTDEERQKLIRQVMNLLSTPGVRAVDNHIEVDLRCKPAVEKAAGIPRLTTPLLDAAYDGYHVKYRTPTLPEGEVDRIMSEAYRFTGTPFDNRQYLCTWKIGEGNQEKHAIYRQEWADVLREVKTLANKEGKQVNIVLDKLASVPEKRERAMQSLITLLTTPGIRAVDNRIEVDLRYRQAFEHARLELPAIANDLVNQDKRIQDPVRYKNAKERILPPEAPPEGAKPFEDKNKVIPYLVAKVRARDRFFSQESYDAYHAEARVVRGRWFDVIDEAQKRLEAEGKTADIAISDEARQEANPSGCLSFLGPFARLVSGSKGNKPQR